MKRFIAVFGVIVIITMHCLSFYPAKAAITSVDYGEMLNTYLGAAETAMALSQGANIDWSNIEMPTGSDTWTDQEKAQYIVSWIGAYRKLGQKAIYDWLFPDNPDYTGSVISAQTAAIGLASNSNIDTLDIKAQLDNIIATQSQAHVFQRYTDKVIARWNEYNTNYINDYLDIMEMTSDGDPNIIDVPPTLHDLALQYVSWNPTPIAYPPSTNGDFNPVLYKQYTYVFNSNPAVVVPGYNSYVQVNFYQKFSFLITPVENSTVVNVSNNSGSRLKWNNINTNAQYRYSTYNGVTGYFFDGWNYNAHSVPNGSYTSYEQALSTILTYTRNADVYEGTSFASATPIVIGGTVIERGVNVTIPDAVIDSGTDDGKIVAHPIYYPDTMNTDKAIDIDLDKVIDAIASRIAAGETDITFDDVVDAGAAVKLDGTTLTDADTVVKDVSVPIARAKVDTINGVIPTIDVVSPLPPLPPLNPGDYSGEGFTGMTVLARIINVTVQGLPEPLILTFFGVVFGAVILGIIKILHH